MHPPLTVASPARPLWPAPLAGIVALALYARTLAPGLTWAHHAADGGDLLAAALTRGVPHPSGYPTYQMLLRAAIALFPGEPARAGNWLSALCAAAAAALFADLAGRVLARIVSGGTKCLSENSAEAAPMPPVAGVGARAAGFRISSKPNLRALAALVAALTWAASPIFWGQAVVTEVYALNALLVVVLLWLLWRWREAVDAGGRGAPGWAWLVGAGLALGLGLGNHLTLLLMLPGATVWLWAGRRDAGRTLARDVLAALGAAVLGFAVYAYLPLAAAVEPPVNWGDPRTPAQLWALVSGEVYRGLVFGLPPAYLPGRLGAWSAEALRQFGGPWGVILALIGLWRLDRHLHAWWQATLVTFVAYSVYAIGYNTPDSFVYLIPAGCVAALWLAAGLAWVLEAATQGLARISMSNEELSAGHAAPAGGCGVTGGGASSRASAWVLRATLVVLVLAVPAISAARFWGENDLSHDREASNFVTRALVDAAPDALILTSSDGPTFALWYTVYGLGQRTDIAPVNVSLVSFDWYRRTLAGRYPDLAAALSVFDPTRPTAWLGALAAGRPLYRAETLAIPLSGYEERPAGSLVRLIRRPNQ
jgi:hypothetical protein